MKRLFLFFLVMLLVFSAPLYVAAASEDNTIQPRWIYFTTVSASLDINWLGVATYSGSAQVSGAYSVKTVIYLQQYKNSNWVTLDTASFTSVASAAGQDRYAVERGYTYRVNVVAYVYDENGTILESASATDTFIF